VSPKPEDSYLLRLAIARRVRVETRELARDDFYEWLWGRFGSLEGGLLGVHEGTLLSEAAAEQGLETESWTVDSAEAPRERDWVGHQSEAQAELYFASRSQAEAASGSLEGVHGVRVLALELQPAKDWDAEWKASFLGSAEGLRLPPDWRVVPYWVTNEQAKIVPGEFVIRINPGAGFGTGTHETTQLCLGAIAEAFGAGGSAKGAPVRALDFGSGSGILSIGLAIRGAKVDAIEIDPLAIDNAKENARLNSVEAGIRFSDELSSAAGPYGIVVANILRPVLLEFAEALVSRLAPSDAPGPGPALILSGLIERDVAEVSACYRKLLGCEPEVRALGEWRCLVWAPIA
jgi:ribosomal protein L11 methyltransferase